VKTCSCVTAPFRPSVLVKNSVPVTTVLFEGVPLEMATRTRTADGPGKPPTSVTLTQ
jgi:hypothetical protein